MPAPLEDAEAAQPVDAPAGKDEASVAGGEAPAASDRVASDRVANDLVASGPVASGPVDSGDVPVARAVAPPEKDLFDVDEPGAPATARAVPGPQPEPDGGAQVAAKQIITTAAASETFAEPAIPKPPGGLRRLGRVLLRVAAVVAVVAALLLGGFVYLGIGTRFDAPDWLRSRVEQRLEQHLGGLSIAFGGIQVVVNQGWRPRVSLRDVTLQDADGARLVRLADAQASLAMRPLLRGQVRPKSISLSGLYGTLTREIDGGLALSLAEGEAPLREAATLPELIEQWDRQLETPILSALVSIETEAVTLRYEDARLGRVWTLDGGSIRMERRGQDIDLAAGFSLLSGRDYVGTIEANYDSAIGDKAAQFGVLVNSVASEDIAAQSAALGWLEVLRAPISGSLRGGIDSDGLLGPVSASLQIGEGVVQPTPQARPVAIQGAQSYFTYLPDLQELRFNELSVNTGWGSGSMDGRAHLMGVDNGQLTDLVGQLRFQDISLNHNQLSEAPVDLAGVTMDFKLELDPFRLRLGEMLVRDGDTRILLDGDVTAGADGWRYALNGRANQISAARVKEVWPLAAPPKPRQWVQENLLEGMARDVNFALRGRGTEKPFVHLDLAFEEAKVRFQKSLPPLQQAAGQFSLHGTRLVAIATSGFVMADEGGPVDAAGTSFIIPDTSVRDGGPGIARVVAEGSVTAALSLLNRPPLQIMDKAGLPVDLADGRVVLDGTLSLPLRNGVQPEEIRYHYKGQIRDVRSARLVPEEVVTAEVLQISGDQDHVNLRGAGALSGIPATARWQQAVGPAALRLAARPEGAPPVEVEGTLELSADSLQALRITLPPGSVNGLGEVNYRVEITPDQPPRLFVNSDLDGVGLRIDALSWRLPQARTGQLELEATLAQPPQVDLLRLEAPGLSAQGQVRLGDGGAFEQAQFGALRVGDWFRGALTLSTRGNRQPAISVSSGTLDLRRMPEGSEAGGQGGGASGSAQGGGPITLRLDQVQVTDSIALTDYEGRFSTTGGFNGEFSARLNGQTRVDGVVVPKGNDFATRIRSDDAGGVFRAAGVLRHGSGGSFEMSLVPAPGAAGEYDGQINVRNTRIKEAPSMAALINALSLVGLIDQLAGQGILFTNVEANFRLGPTHLIIRDSSAVGPSMGLSLDGNYDLQTSALNMRGVLSPIYILNAIGRVLTRKGEGLIGFAFTLKGTADDPQVQVNPLSGLAPGMFREIFRGPAPTLPGEEPAPPPTPRSERDRPAYSRSPGEDR
ncbi:AsmA-like C-terminal region-containing protein [Phaeobacter sp.]|uniref:YhdP family protein n=1 Tax=Phaeobacter sp. TaxID=1902409 RepID=UPI0025EC2CFA|nr:AsmA-like C-terminal region-containing protein [Phaeobacter sp.]